MKSRTWLTAVAVAVVSLAAACTPTRVNRSAGEHVDDAVVTARVKAALVRDPATSARNIDVETYRGVVQLNGFIDADESKGEATRVVRSVPGVKEVQNNLRTGSERTAGEYIDDKVITAKLKAALIEDPTVAAHEVDVKVHDGVVQLGGFVDNSAQKTQATEVARRIAGVKQVENELEVKQR